MWLLSADSGFHAELACRPVVTSSSSSSDTRTGQPDCSIGQESHLGYSGTRMSRYAGAGWVSLPCCCRGGRSASAGATPRASKTPGVHDNSCRPTRNGGTVPSLLTCKNKECLGCPPGMRNRLVVVGRPPGAADTARGNWLLTSPPRRRRRRGPAARPRAIKASAPRSPAASAPPIPLSHSSTPAREMGEEQRNGDVRGRTAPEHPWRPGRICGRPTGASNQASDSVRCGQAGHCGQADTASRSRGAAGAPSGTDLAGAAAPAATVAARERSPSPRCCTRSNSVHSRQVGTGTSRLGAEATAARKAVNRSSISRSRRGNPSVVVAGTLYHRVPTIGQRFHSRRRERGIGRAPSADAMFSA